MPHFEKQARRRIHSEVTKGKIYRREVMKREMEFQSHIPFNKSGGESCL